MALWERKKSVFSFNYNRSWWNWLIPRVCRGKIIFTSQTLSWKNNVYGEKFGFENIHFLLGAEKSYPNKPNVQQQTKLA